MQLLSLQDKQKSHGLVSCFYFAISCSDALLFIHRLVSADPHWGDLFVVIDIRVCKAPLITHSAVSGLSFIVRTELVSYWYEHGFPLHCGKKERYFPLLVLRSSWSFWFWYIVLLTCFWLCMMSSLFWTTFFSGSQGWTITSCLPTLLLSNAFICGD